MSKAFGIVNFAGNHIQVDGLQAYRPVGAFSFLGRYRTIDFPISNMSNSGINHIEVFVKRNPRSLTEHLGTGRHYNINSKRGKLHILYTDDKLQSDLYNHDVSAFMYNMECIEKVPYPYVIIAPSYMVYSMDYSKLLEKHLESGADITILYQNVDTAKDEFMNCNVLNLNKQKGVLSIERNRGTAKNRNISLDTYVMSKELFMELVKKAAKFSSMYTLRDIIDDECSELDIRGIAHHGYVAAISDFKSYYDANMRLIDYETAQDLFAPDWPIYTRTNDSSPTQYYETSNVKKSVVSNGCEIEGTIENSVIGRGCIIKKGAVVKNCVILPGATIGEDVHVENAVVDKQAKIVRVKEVVAKVEEPAYVGRGDIL